MKKVVRASEIANFLGATPRFDDFLIERAVPITKLVEHSISFLKNQNTEIIKQINSVKSALVIVGDWASEEIQVPHIILKNPRLGFAKVLQRFFTEPPPNGIEKTAVVDPGASIAESAYVGHYSIIEDGVAIGPRSVILDHVVIRRNTQIGSDVLVKSHTVIGEEGFGFEFGEDGKPVRIPHLGSVVIGNGVEIGAMNVIARGTLEDTVIHSGVKIDDHVFIAHNVVIEENAVIIAGAEISGSVTIGRGAWVAPQAAIINKVHIGERALVGIGAVVTKSVAENAVVAGNPAKPLRKRFEQ